MFRGIRSSTLSRSRWAALGAAVAVSLGAGGIGLIAHAANSAPSSFISITPCRLFDTRSAPATVGDRNTPLNANEEFVRPVWGTNGSCTIPSTATAISYNLTVPNGLEGFLTLYPADATLPNASSINPVTGQGVKVNGGIVGLSAAGAIKLFSLRGPVDALLDITGYFQAATAGPAGPRGFSAWDVIPSGQTVTGEIVYDAHEGATALVDSLGVDLPGVAPVPLDAAMVSFDAASGAADADPTCDGTLNAPTAPPGQVCIYLGANGGIDVTTLNGDVLNLPTRSFRAIWVSTGTDNGDEFIYATWAYTAP